ncbi:MAG: M81 family metallopeptidase, partial [Actinomycetota bacterium]
MRVGVALLYHETNTFADASTGRTKYERFDVWRGAELVDHWAGSRTAPAGMVETIREIGGEPVALYGAFAQPSGTIEADAYARLREELLGALKANLPLDALAVALHGAGVADGVDDIEGDLVAAMREIVGSDVPIVGSFDLHGNLTQEMADGLDGFFGFRLYPHEDMYESGAEAVRMIPVILEGKVRPVTHVERIPVLLPPSTTDRDPAAEVNRRCEALEDNPGIIDCTFFHGFPYADIPQAGASIVVVADGDRDLARAAAQEVAAWVWDHREDFRAADPDAEEAVRRAAAASEHPVVINETSDNTGGGAPGDGTHLLRAMIEAELKNSCFASIFDPEVAEQAHAAGTGATIDIELGGKH